MKTSIALAVSSMVLAGSAQAQTPPRRSPAQEFVNPTLDTSAKVENGRVCYGYLRTGGRATSVCVPLQNFADTVPASADLAALSFSGNSLAVTEKILTSCYIPRGDDPGFDSQKLNDPSVSSQLTLTCPSSGRPGSTYELTILFTPEYYLPLELADGICGPDKSTEGSEFDRYVQSTLGPLENKDIRSCGPDTCVTAYYWLNTSSTLILKRGATGPVGKCPNATAVQTDWSVRLLVNNAVGEPFAAYISAAANRQRESSFTRF